MGNDDDVGTDIVLLGAALSTVGMALVACSLTAAQMWLGKPLKELGHRPLGKGLWSYLYHHLVDGVGVFGYDSNLGAFSPVVRLLLHMATVCFLCAVTLVAVGNTKSLTIWLSSLLPIEARDDPAAVISAVVIGSVVVKYCAVMYWCHHLLPNVSHPGGPRKAKIQRVPRWKSQTTRLDATPTWTCVIAQESHSLTLRKFAISAESKEQTPALGLTGEPSGRQTWTWAPEGGRAKSSSAPDENLVQEMACGGREPGFNPSKNPNSCDQVFRAQQIRGFLARNSQGAGAVPNLKDAPKTAKDAAKKAVQFYQMLQMDDGHWGADYGGPMFLMPGLIIGWYVMGQPQLMLDQQQRSMMRHYLTVHQQTDGGWGTHIESPSTMFGTTLCYVALRLLGADSEDEVCVAGRRFLRDNGGAIMTSSWAKFYLCLLGVMEWDGHNSVPAEMWLLPRWFPFHPGRLWCHCRMVYLPMGYLYGVRFVYEKAETDPLILALREELYLERYDGIPWIKTRHCVAPMDNYSPIPLLMKLLQNVLARYETWSIFQPFKNWVRAEGLKFSLGYMAAEDLQTNFVDIGPVNKVLNLISAFHASGRDLQNPAVQNHMMRVADYLWVAEDGMKMQGYNGCQCWDTSFAIQAVAECGLTDEFPALSRKVWGYLERTQILSTETSRASPAFEYESEENRQNYYRHVSKGGWPFSTSAHGWPISDCTGEGLKGVLCLWNSEVIKTGVADKSLRPIDESRLHDAVNVIMTLQNEDGGFPTYENNRGWGWYEKLNPSEVFGDIMIDYSYVELTMASLTALVEFRKLFPNHREVEIKHAVQRGRDFLKSIQRKDGSWYGSWACCFCYAGWFGIEGLIAAGESRTSPAVLKGCGFLLAHQRENGGWGEDFTSCYDKGYAQDGMALFGDKGSGVVSTAWALLALAAAKCDDVSAVRRGVHYLMKRQLPCGDWPQEGISGVFNRACGITYTSYRNVFPIWALGRCHEVYGESLSATKD